MSNRRGFMQIPEFTPLPQSKLVTVNWSALNKRQAIDTGQMTKAINVSLDEFPYVVPRKKFKESTTETLAEGYSALIALGQALYVPLFANATTAKDGYLKPIAGEGAWYYYSVASTNEDTYYYPASRSSYSRVRTLAIGGNTYLSSYDEREFLLAVKIERANDEIQAGKYFNSDYSYHRPSQYVVCNNNRVFSAGAKKKGVSGGYPSMVMVSEFGEIDFSGTGTEANNAWQSYSDEESAFNGICAYRENIIAFKKNYMYVISGQKNPYVIMQCATVGTVDERTVCEIGGILYFLSHDGVYKYNGAGIQNISMNVITGGIDETAVNCGGTDGRHYFLQCKVLGNDSYRFYVYDTMFQTWTEYTIPEAITGVGSEIVQFAQYNNAAYFISLKSKTIFSILNETSEVIEYTEYEGINWEIETDFRLDGTIDIKHVDKLQLLADIAPGSEISVDISYDNKEFKRLYSFTNAAESLIQKRILIKPKKTAHYGYKIRISGTGYSKLYQMEAITSGRASQNKA